MQMPMLHCPCRFTSRSADAARSIAARDGSIPRTAERDLVRGVHQGDTVAVGAVKDPGGGIADVIAEGRLRRDVGAAVPPGGGIAFPSGGVGLSRGGAGNQTGADDRDKERDEQ